ncbi:hypothetical protein [Marinospirillum sp.]|uniref:hypothetical protein n=1 Tax=Marinospirillum sp. TaxID=2183934 RepID=UPI00384AC7D8
MNKFTVIAALCLFGLMACASPTDKMQSEEDMMKDDMQESMDHNSMKKDEMSDS